jgi:uncharacterized protein (TIGR00299 family) protein
MAKILYFDCFAGASGDMILGALLDAGLPLAELEAALGGLMTPGSSLSATRVLRSGLSATRFELHEPGRDPARAAPIAEQPPVSGQAGGPSFPRAHGHAPAEHPVHEPHDDHRPHHAHRSLAEILALIGGSALSEHARARTSELYRRLAAVEADIHQMPIERVHLHEVGALDSIIDIAGAVFGLEWFRADRIASSPLNVGGGMVRSAHGVFPVPAPATVRLLENVPVYSTGVQQEMVTPTGALLVVAHATSFGPMPPMRIERVGYGAGHRDLQDTPNVLRLLIGRDDGEVRGDRVVIIECEIDDMNPQIFGALMDDLLAAGALDVFYTPIQMKKNRPGTLVTVIGRPSECDRLAGMLFRETTTLGLRYQEVAREALERESTSVQTPHGSVRVKVARRGGRVVSAAPEFDDCARIARRRQLPIKDVQAAAMKAYLDGMNSDK